MRVQVQTYFQQLHEQLLLSVTEMDGASPNKDLWQHAGGGGGCTCVWEGKGKWIARGGVNFSAVQGSKTAALAPHLSSEAENFYATGVSVVLHPHHPLRPIIHMNLRYFEENTGKSWFGGGIDLTPHYVFDDEASAFHKTLKKCCDNYTPQAYAKFKTWADDYFFLPHRQETRGVGGVFFDQLNAQSEGQELSDIFTFVQSLGAQFSPLYKALMTRSREESYGEKEKKWQALRRSRYVEFNLLYDKGTRFGLGSGGRTESILVSLPPQAAWSYNTVPIPDTPEHHTLLKLKKGIPWHRL